VLVDAHPVARITSARVSDATLEQPPPGAPTLCLGDAIVDLVCERPVEALSDCDAFVPHLGGTAATVAVAAARHGAHVALAGGAGDDLWGRWLRGRLGREGVGVSQFELVPGVSTPVAFVTVDSEGEPSSSSYGGPIVGGLSDRLEDAVRVSAALFISICGPAESDVTMRARELALSVGRPVVFAPRLCVARWRSRAEAAATANACVPDALLVCASAGDAALMTGENDPERAALALLKAGARMVVITLEVFDGAILRGELRRDVEGVPASVISRLGAGGAFVGILLARLAMSAFYPPAVAASLGEAMAEAARACERWGALD
jgi:sugar/nucleoside kinase (ribokinase family)